MGSGKTLILGILFLAAPAHAQTVIRGPYLQIGTHASMTVRWRLDQVQPGRLWVGPAPGVWTHQVDSPAGTDHAATVSGLAPAAEYFYAVGLQSGLLLAGGTADFRFKTAPLPGSRDPIRAWVLGDSGAGNANARGVRDVWMEFSGGVPPDLWLMLGDNAYPDGSDVDHQVAVFDMYPETLKASALWTTLGNHDANDGPGGFGSSPYFSIFSLPTQGEAGGAASGTEFYYSFDWGNVHFVCLDSEVSDRSPQGPMATWLSADLASANADWLIAFWHHPPYSKGSHDSDIALPLIEMRENLLPILEQHGVDVVMTGHSHSYERSFLLSGHYGYSLSLDPSMVIDSGNGSLRGSGPYRKVGGGPPESRGSVFVVNGASSKAAGGPLNHPVMVRSLNIRGSVVLDIHGLQLDVRYLDATGVLSDGFTLVKNGAVPGAVSEEIAPTAGTWRYSDIGVNLGTAWRDPAFDDSQWPSGPAPMGTGFPLLQTTMGAPGPGLPVPSTVYFRRSFSFDGVTEGIRSLRWSILYDDGYVAYLNGQEIGRSLNFAGSNVTFGTTTSYAHEPFRYEIADLPWAVGLLVPGINVLAVEVHQNAATNGDMAFDAGLVWEGFRGPLGACARGGFGEDILLVNGRNGESTRSFEVPASSPLSLDLLAPTAFGVAANFVIFAKLETPTPQEAFPAPSGASSLCFTPWYLVPTSSAEVTVASSLPAWVGTPSPPVPFHADFPAGIPFVGMEIVLQAALAPVGQMTWTASNAVRIVIR